jgi:predicted double-glycine peptidase
MRKAFLLIIIYAAISGCAPIFRKALDFPVTRQAYDYSCGPSAVQAVMAYYGIDFRESQLIDTLRTDKNDGTLVRHIVNFLHSEGFSVDVKEHMNKEDLFRYIDRKIPVIVLIQAWGDNADFNNHYADTWKDGHFVVVTGYSRKNILFSDPCLFRTGYIPIAEFMERWHDYDEGDTGTYHLGLAVYGKEPKFSHRHPERIK